MQNGDVQTAKPFDKLGRIALLGKLEAFVLEQPGKQYTICTEAEASQLLLALSLVMKENAAALSKPLQPVAGFNPKKFNQRERIKIIRMANKFKKAAANGMALQYCNDEFGHTPLEFKGLEIIFGYIK